MICIFIAICLPDITCLFQMKNLYLKLHKRNAQVNLKTKDTNLPWKRVIISAVQRAPCLGIVEKGRVLAPGQSARVCVKWTVKVDNA